MSVEFIVSVNSKIYEISEIITKVTFTDKLNDGCSKLEFTYKNDDLVITNGSIVRFKYNNSNIFYGYVFKASRNKSKEITVIAYDQLKYCKAKDTIVILKDSTTSLVKRMTNYFKLKTGTIADTKYVLPTGVQDNSSWLDIIYDSISDTLVNTDNNYALRDEFGSVTLRNIKDLTINLIVGDESLVYDFNYDKSIDDEFYNIIKIYVKGDSDKDSTFVVQKSDSSVKKFGPLQYFETAEKNEGLANIKEKAKTLLKLYNQELETLELECIGDTRIRAGSSFYVYINDIDMNKLLYVKEVKHSFLPTHTMEVEVAI